MNETNAPTFVALQPNARPWPYLVIRYIAAVYKVAEIRIVATQEEHDADTARGLTIIDQDHRPGAPISDSLRRRLIAAAIDISRSIGHQVCVVFAPRDAVYVDRRGNAFESTQPPHGGVLVIVVAGPRWRTRDHASEVDRGRAH
jgi:hypothetical protein